MSIEHVKRHAKRLSRLLPSHITSHKDPAALSACQELAAQVHGYPNFHAASKPQGTHLEESPQPGDPTAVTAVAAPEDEPGYVASWRLNNEPYQAACDPPLLATGQITYGPDSDRQIYSGHYRLVDFGVKPDKTTTLTAIVFVPQHEGSGQGRSDFQLLLNRCEIRATVARQVWTEIQTSNPSLQKPDLFVLAVPAGASLGGDCHALCFDIDKVAEFTSRAAIETRYFRDMYQQLNEIGVLRPYERFVLREVRRSLDKHVENGNQCKVRIQHWRETFQNCLEVMARNIMLFEHQRNMGLQVSYEPDSWMTAALADISRFDEAIGRVYGNIRPQRRTYSGHEQFLRHPKPPLMKRLLWLVSGQPKNNYVYR